MATQVQKENRIVQYVRETRAELRKVVWPSRQEAINLTLVVIITVVGMAAFLGTIDYLLTGLIRLLINR